MGRSTGQPREYERLFDEEGNEALVRNFIRIRTNSRLTQKQLAIEMGISPQHLSLIETCKIKITATTIFLAARVLEIDPEEFMKGVKLTPERDPRKKIDE
jgi:transcriptional regulator with XRE-family HTH domain